MVNLDKYLTVDNAYCYMIHKANTDFSYSSVLDASLKSADHFSSCDSASFLYFLNRLRVGVKRRSLTWDAHACWRLTYACLIRGLDLCVFWKLSDQRTATSACRNVVKSKYTPQLRIWEDLSIRFQPQLSVLL